MQRTSPWNIVWPSLVGHLLIVAVLLKAFPPAAVGTTGTSDAVDVVMVEVKARSARVGAPRGSAALPRGAGQSTHGQNTPTAASHNSHSQLQSNPTLARILARIRRARHYPAEARRKHITGRPVVEFIIRRDGTTTDARIITSSGSAILDTAALETIRRAEPFPYFPDPFPVLINYQLQ